MALVRVKELRVVAKLVSGDEPPVCGLPKLNAGDVDDTCPG
jgi:hypothetical protein